MPIQKPKEMNGQVPQAKPPQEVHFLKEKKVEKENKQQKQERRDIFNYALLIITLLLVVSSTYCRIL